MLGKYNDTLVRKNLLSLSLMEWSHAAPTKSLEEKLLERYARLLYGAWDWPENVLESQPFLSDRTL